MKLKLFLLFAFSYCGLEILQAQPYIQVDTLPTLGTVSHTYLNIQIPTGEMYMKSSRICGQSISKLSSPDPAVKHDMSSEVDKYGNMVRSFSLNFEEELQPKSVSRGVANANFGQQILQFNNYGNTATYRSVFNPDPSASTDLYLDLGIGRSRLDFSDMSLNSVEIHSAFSDVHITYSAPNRTAMEKMDIHAAKAKIVVKNLEMSRAELVSIMNDMGETKIILGGEAHSGGTIFIQQGMGACTLVIDPAHPTKIVLKSGLFSSSKMPDDFQQLDKRTYVNAAYQQAESNEEIQGTNIICNIDFGNISVFTRQ